ncbi:MAG: lytic transglycosylase domain-containing protein [Clostridia bacterium]|nr:lytic transglycosylase domain-containing protein [Clostridia bacterium]
MTEQFNGKMENRKTHGRKTAIAGILIVLAAAALINVALKMRSFYTRVTHPVLYEEYIEKYAEEYTVPEEIIYAVINTESSFDSSALSGAGAMGLMQITKETFWWLLSKNGEDISVEKLYDPETNIKYGTYFLSILYEEYGSWDTVYAAYNAGRSRVNSWLSDNEITKNGKLVNIPYPETAQYVNRVSRNVTEYSKLLER